MNNTLYDKKLGRFVKVMDKEKTLREMKLIRDFFTKTNYIFKGFTEAMKVRGVEITADNLPEAAMMFVNEKQLKASSRRTYFGQILSGFATMKNVAVPKNPIIKRMQKHLLEAMQKENTNKAPHLPIEYILNLTSEKRHQDVLLLITLVCSRIGNARGFRTLSLGPVTSHPTLGQVFPWRVLWFAHKTFRFIGEHRVTIPVPEHLMTPSLQKIIANLPLSKETMMTIKAILKEKKVRKHSLRRSGAKWWEEQGLGLDQLQRITIHTSQAQLIGYLEDSAPLPG